MVAIAGAGEWGGRTQGGDIATHLPPLAPSPHTTVCQPSVDWS
jgi:hypothetical protein